MTQGSIDVMVVDDQPPTRLGLSFIIRKDPSLRFVAEAGDGQEALDVLAERARQGRRLPDVVLMDVRMPVMDGITATERIKRQYPQVKVLILTTYDEDSYAFTGLAVGASGFLLKDSRTHSLDQAVHDVYEGNAILSPRITKEFLAKGIPRVSQSPEAKEIKRRVATLGRREREVAALIAEEGLSNEEIADRLVITLSAVKKDVSRALAKLGARERVNIAVMWRKAGL